MININGTLQSGSSSNYSVNIGADALRDINALKSGTGLAQAQANAQHGVYWDIPAGDLTTSGTGDATIGAKYNVLTDQIVLNSVVQGSGGYIYLNGKIISTSTQDGRLQGKLVINGGSGTVTVNNTTGLQLVTNTINTGVTTPSVIEIVDQLKAEDDVVRLRSHGCEQPAGVEV